MEQPLQHILEGALLAAGKPLSIEKLRGLFVDDDKPSVQEVQVALQQLQLEYATRTLELRQVASGYTFLVRAELGPWVSRLWDEKPQKYSRATLETLVIIAYRQPVTRADIEEIRGVAVSSQIMKSLLEREWIRIIGHRDVPGKPSLYATTKAFLDYFGLKSLDQLPDHGSLTMPLEDEDLSTPPMVVADEIDEQSHDREDTKETSTSGDSLPERDRTLVESGKDYRQ